MRLQPIRTQIPRLILALCIVAVATPLLMRQLMTGQRITEMLDFTSDIRQFSTSADLTSTRKHKVYLYDQHRLDIPSSNDANAYKMQDQKLAAVCADTICGEKFMLEFAPMIDQPRIPEIRHIIWKSANISRYFLQQLQTWQRIHPNWTYVLWRDSDLEPFVRKHFPGKVYQKYQSLPTNGSYGIMRIDMFRYMLMFKFGGVYADLDYSLVSSLDNFRRYPAVITREPEAHAAQIFGLARWPLSVLASPAFFMAVPGHPFFQFALRHLEDRPANSIMAFAGPYGLSEMLMLYYQSHMSMAHPADFVYIAPSYSFYGYEGNRLDSGSGIFLPGRIQILTEKCQDVANSTVPQVQQFCKNLLNLDPITDKSQPLVAIHDLKKRDSVYLDPGGKEFTSNMQDVTLLMRNLKLGDALT